MTEALGKRIVVEGADGTGKSYQARRLYARLAEHGVNMCGFMLDEPDSPLQINAFAEIMESEGWTEEQKAQRTLIPEAVAIRMRLKSKAAGLTPIQNLDGFTDSRDLSWHQQTEPALLAGLSTVVARSHVSSCVYQGYAEGLGIDTVNELTRRRLGEWYMNPDLLFILDITDEDERQRRMGTRDEHSAGDAFESRPNDFQQKLRFGYRRYQKDYGGLLIPADGTRDAVHGLLWAHAAKLYQLAA